MAEAAAEEPEPERGRRRYDTFRLSIAGPMAEYVEASRKRHKYLLNVRNIQVIIKNIQAQYKESLQIINPSAEDLEKQDKLLGDILVHSRLVAPEQALANWNREQCKQIQTRMIPLMRSIKKKKTKIIVQSYSDIYAVRKMCRWVNRFPYCRIVRGAFRYTWSLGRVAEELRVVAEDTPLLGPSDLTRMVRDGIRDNEAEKRRIADLLQSDFVDPNPNPLEDSDLDNDE